MDSKMIGLLLQKTAFVGPSFVILLSIPVIRENGL